jgi:predicted PurR-regulated permease PerM
VEQQTANPAPVPGLVARAATVPPARRGLGAFALRVAVAVLITVAILAVVAIAWQGLHILTEAFAGILFAVFLTALSNWVQKRTGLAYGWSLALVLTALFLIAAGLSSLLADRLAKQIVDLMHKLPQSIAAVRDYIGAYPWGRSLLETVPNATNALTERGEFARVTGLVSGVFDFGVAVLVIFFVGVFGAAQPALYRAGLLHLVPARGRPRMEEALDAVVYNLRWWLVGQVVLMIMMGITTALGLWLIGLPLALTLGVIAGILEMVPYLGPWISAVPAALIALLVGPWHLIMTLVLFLVLHIVEGYLLAPLVQRRAVHLPPALTLVAQVLLGELLGVLGLFVAAPLTVTVVVFVKLLYVQDTLGDDEVRVPGGPRAAKVAANGTS